MPRQIQFNQSVLQAAVNKAEIDGPFSREIDLYKAVAEELECSPQTIKKYVENMGIRSKTVGSSQGNAPDSGPSEGRRFNRDQFVRAIEEAEIDGGFTSYDFLYKEVAAILPRGTKPAEVAECINEWNVETKTAKELAEEAEEQRKSPPPKPKVKISPRTYELPPVDIMTLRPNFVERREHATLMDERLNRVKTVGVGKSRRDVKLYLNNGCSPSKYVAVAAYGTGWPAQLPPKSLYLTESDLFDNQVEDRTVTLSEESLQDWMYRVYLWTIEKGFLFIPRAYCHFARTYHERRIADVVQERFDEIGKVILDSYSTSTEVHELIQALRADLRS